MLFAIGVVVFCLLVWPKYLTWRARRMLSVSGRAVLVTGCDTGFGNILAKRLDAMGVHVIAGCLTSGAVEELGKTLSANSRAIRLDVADEKSVESAYEVVQKQCGDKGLWAVVNNAGIASGGYLDFQTMETYRRVMDINFFGTVRVTKTFLPLIRLARGRIVNMASIAGRFSFTGMTAYCSSKFAVEAFSDGIRRELYHWGICVSIIEPGFTRTPILESGAANFRREFESAPAHIRQMYGEAWFTQATATVDALRKASDPGVVIEAYVHAIASTEPKHRYRTGTDANVIAYIALLPSLFLDWLLRLKQPIPAITSAR